jgi:hypothetical protein
MDMSVIIEVSDSTFRHLTVPEEAAVAVLLASVSVEVNTAAGEAGFVPNADTVGSRSAALRKT